RRRSRAFRRARRGAARRRDVLDSLTAALRPLAGRRTQGPHGKARSRGCSAGAALAAETRLAPVPSLPMPMTVVRVRDVGMRVRERIVPGGVGVRFRARTLMRMRVMDVMDVQMVMFHRFVSVHVGVL